MLKYKHFEILKASMETTSNSNINKPVEWYFACFCGSELKFKSHHAGHNSELLEEMKEAQKVKYPDGQFHIQTENDVSNICWTCCSDHMKQFLDHYKIEQVKEFK